MAKRGGKSGLLRLARALIKHLKFEISYGCVRTSSKMSNHSNDNQQRKPENPTSNYIYVDRKESPLADVL